MKEVVWKHGPFKYELAALPPFTEFTNGISGRRFIPDGDLNLSLE